MLVAVDACQFSLFARLEVFCDALSIVLICVLILEMKYLRIYAKTFCTRIKLVNWLTGFDIPPFPDSLVPWLPNSPVPRFPISCFSNSPPTILVNSYNSF